jgi:hypothetical protein
MARRPKWQQTTPANEGGDGIRDFLVRELPPGKTNQAPYLANALLKAGARYDRYTARRKEWADYATRRNRLKSVTKLADNLASCLRALDIISRDDLASRFDPKVIEALLGSLSLLSKETMELAKDAQQNGRPSDLAEERWIFELADIYENAFSDEAHVSGSGGGPVRHRGKFYRLLELSRPESFPRFGKLSVRQIERALKARRSQRRRTVDLSELLERSGVAKTK